MTDALVEQQIAVALDYFRRTEAGDGSGAELFSADVEVWFPSFGRRTGIENLGVIGGWVGSKQQRLHHVIDSFAVTAQENRVVVDGVLVGIAADGRDWPVPGAPEVRFCNIFEFDGTTIVGLRLYVDPDLAGIGSARFPAADGAR
jgi:hypothetical protein